MEIKLSEYNDNLYDIEEEKYKTKCGQIIKILKEKLPNIDFNDVAKSNIDYVIYTNISGWIFNYFKDELYEAYKLIDYDIKDYEKQSIYAFAMSIARDRSNIDILYTMYHDKGIIKSVKQYEDGMYEIETNNFGVIPFYKALSLFSDDQAVLNYVDSLGLRIKDGCHEVTYYLLKKYKKFKAVTALVKKELGCNQFHSFILDEENDYVIDLARNIAMPREVYYMLNDVEVINVVSYDECLKQNEETAEYDESGTLFDLLRNALYKHYSKYKKSR